MPDVCSFCSSAKDRVTVRPTKSPWLPDAQQAAAASHRCPHHPAPRSASALRGLSREGRKGCDRRIPLGRFAESREGKALAPHLVPGGEVAAR